MIDVWYLIGTLTLPIVVAVVAILMRLFNRIRPLEKKNYIIVGVVQIILIGINMQIPVAEKIINLILTVIILTVGYFIDRSLKLEKQ